MKKLLVATKNQGKLREISNFLSDLPVKILSLSDIGVDDEFEETGKTYKDNSQKKAIFYAKKSGFPVVADDGGIEINVLKGLPGLHSKRWAKDEKEIIQKLDKLTKEISEDRRGAIFKAIISFALPNGKVWNAQGNVRGIIAKNPHRRRIIGYPYRSFFYLPRIQKYYHEDELSDEEQKLYNHRYKAIQKLIPIIKKELGIKI